MHPHRPHLIGFHLVRMETQTDHDWDAMRKWSKAIFRRDHRLAVAIAAISAEPGKLYAEAIASELGIAQTEAARHLEAFESVGMLQRDQTIRKSGPQGGRPGAAYSRTTDDFWNCLEELGERFRRTPPTTGSSRSER